MALTRPLQEWLTVLVYGSGAGATYTIVQPSSGIMDAGQQQEAVFDVQLLGYCSFVNANHSLILQTASCAEGPWREITHVDAAPATQVRILADAKAGSGASNKFERYLRWVIHAAGVTLPLDTTFKICVSLR
jgi:hypothetical protein